MKSLHNYIPNTSLEIDIMDISMTKHMKALLLKSMAYGDSYELNAMVIHHWFDDINYEEHENYDVKDYIQDWPKYKIVKDTMRFYFHVGNAFGVDLVRGFIKVLNKQMEWTGVSHKSFESSVHSNFLFERWLNE
jgi:hypothetical protein